MLVLASRLIEMAVELCEDERRLVAERQGSVVDGGGTERIVGAINGCLHAVDISWYN